MIQKVIDVENDMSCQVMKVTKMETNAGKSGYDLVRIEFDKLPKVLDVVERVRWKTGKDPMDPDATYIGEKCMGKPMLRPPKKRDGIELYQTPPEDMVDMLARIQKATFGYVDLLAWRVQCVNAKLDLLHKAGIAKRVDPCLASYQVESGLKEFPAAAEYNPQNPWTPEFETGQLPEAATSVLPYIIPEAGKNEEAGGEKMEQKEDATPNEYDEEQEGGPKTKWPDDDQTPKSAEQETIPAVL